MNLIKRYGVIIVIIFILSMIIKPILCVLVLGTLGAYIGFEAIFFLKNINKSGIECEGKIVEYQSDSDGDKTPVVEFTSLSGELIREQPYVYTSTDLNKLRTFSNTISESVKILYDQNNPKKFILTKEREFNSIVFLILILIGIFFIGLSILSLLGVIKVGL